MSGFVDRENEIFDVLQRFESDDLDFVVVGGYGVSAYQHRFSVDADIVVRSDDLDRFVEVLEAQGFEKDADQDLVYSGRYLAYVKDQELPVTIDVLVDERQSRKTSASWSYDYFLEHSVEKSIEGSEESVRVRVPTEELLIAVKLHSGRLTDTRDAVALIEDADLDEVESHIDRGDQDQLLEVLQNVEATVSDDDFEDSFKGVFSRGTVPEDQIRKLERLLSDVSRNGGD